MAANLASPFTEKGCFPGNFFAALTRESLLFDALPLGDHCLNFTIFGIHGEKLICISVDDDADKLANIIKVDKGFKLHHVT